VGAVTDSAILRALIDSSEELRQLYFRIKPVRPDVAELILAAQLEIADAIGKVATGKTVSEVIS